MFEHMGLNAVLPLQDACLLPPRLVLQPERLPPVSPATTASVKLANAGGLPLAVHLALEPRSRNLLAPALWLDPGTSSVWDTAPDGGATTPSSDALSTVSRSARSGSGLALSAGTLAEGLTLEQAKSGSSVALSGGAAAPLRLAGELRVPVAVRGSLIRRRECDSHFIALSTRPRAPARRGEGSLFRPPEHAFSGMCL